MIRFIRGEYLYYDSGALIVETAAGIGFRINVSDTSALLTAKEGDTIEVFTYMQVKEDGMSLFGFADNEGLKLFEQLISVNGVGPKAGLAIMSLGSVNQIKLIISSGDAVALSMAQGIGKKTAERLILELSDKLSPVPFDDVNTARPDIINTNIAERNEAILGLTTLGYSKKEAEQAVNSVAEEGLSAENYIKKALKYLL